MPVVNLSCVKRYKRHEVEGEGAEKMRGANTLCMYTDNSRIDTAGISARGDF